MFAQLPMYQNQGTKALKKDLSNSLALDKYLGHPHKYYPTIHVAGTNGKGTTCHMLSAVLQMAGYKVGLYTSPHLKDFRERIKINGSPISKDEVIHFIDKTKLFIESNHLSFFELTVGMAFESFKRHNVDIAIIEVGLGGRLDSTNIIKPVLSIITSIDFDHVEILGDTLKKIASEKAGIIKTGVPCIINESRNELRLHFKNIAHEKDSCVTFVNEHLTNSESNVNTESLNRNTAYSSLKTLRLLGYDKIDQSSIDDGLKNYAKVSSFLGRYQTINDNPKVIIDVAHNPAGIERLMSRIIDEEKFEDLHIIYGTVKGKDMDDILNFLPFHAEYYLCEPNNPRKLEIEILESKFKNYRYKTYTDPKYAYTSALKNSKKEDLIVITGSNFLIADFV